MHLKNKSNDVKQKSPSHITPAPGSLHLLIPLARSSSTRHDSQPHLFQVGTQKLKSLLRTLIQLNPHFPPSPSLISSPASVSLKHGSPLNIIYHSNLFIFWLHSLECDLQEGRVVCLSLFLLHKIGRGTRNTT